MPRSKVETAKAEYKWVFVAGVDEMTQGITSVADDYLDEFLAERVHMGERILIVVPREWMRHKDMEPKSPCEGWRALSWLIVYDDNE